MIDEIHVQDVALIRDASICPSSGLTAITGETGAGKTALLSACRLLMGMRADRGLVREGESAAFVEGRFFGTTRNMSSDEISESTFDDEMIVRRSVTSDGRSRVRINGEMASVGELSSEIGPLIDLCSQHDQQQLLQTSAQREILDLWGEDSYDGALEEYKEAFAEAKEAKRRLDEIISSRELSNASLEEARFALKRIDELNPVEGEYEELIKTLEKSENAELLATSSDGVYKAISDEGAILDRLNEAAMSLEDAAKFDSSLNEKAALLREAGFILEDVSRDILSYRDGIEFDPETLAANQERAAAYQSLLRVYGPEVKDVLAVAEDARRKIDMTDNSEEAQRLAKERLDRATDCLEIAADSLSKKRKTSASSLGSVITEVMKKLEMGSAEIVCNVEQRDEGAWTADGPDLVEFLFRPSAAMQLRPLSRIASGGELSRVMLAIHVVMGNKENTSTLIFDEIDAGVGGSTANALSETLAELAKTHQVIVVTHLAQIAARAEKHYVASKSNDDGYAETAIVEVTRHKRTEEIARMLSGNITEASIAHAKELLG